MKIFNMMALALTFSLSACIGGGGSNTKVASGGDQQNQVPAPNDPESPSISHSNLVVRVGDDILAYYLDGSGRTGRFIMADTGYIVSVDMWTGQPIEQNIDLHYLNHNCSGTFVVKADALLPNQVFVINGAAYKVSNQSTQSTEKSYSSNNSCIDYAYMRDNIGGLWATLNFNSDDSVDLDSTVYSVQSTSIPNFPYPINLEYDN